MKEREEGAARLPPPTRGTYCQDQTGASADSYPHPQQQDEVVVQTAETLPKQSPNHVSTVQRGTFYMVLPVFTFR